jgi:hypothetical protein
MTKIKLNFFFCAFLFIAIGLLAFNLTDENPFLKIKNDGSIIYIPDEKGNTIPDFSRVGYHQGDKEIPNIPIVKRLTPSPVGESGTLIQAALDEVAALKPNKDGYRGAILLEKGIYLIPGVLKISASGIVLRGIGDNPRGTKLVATAKTQQNLIEIAGHGTLREEKVQETIVDDFVPVGAFSFRISNASSFKVGDQILVYRPATPNWITAIKMDQIVERQGTIQWKPSSYNLRYERKITKIKGNEVFIDNPIVMQIDKQYGGGKVMKYTFEGRIAEVGIEQMLLESNFESDTAENHGWIAISFAKAENCWVNKVTSRYFGFGCVNIGSTAKCITVMNSQCLDAKSIITGGRRYSFNIDGQQNLVMNCKSAQGRHDYVTGAYVCGPNVFFNSTAVSSNSDIGPHHRWATGTLYDNIKSDGLIDIEDRGNYGTGHGWSGVTQVLWNCTGSKVAVQSPWTSGKNYSIGTKGEKAPGRFKDRPTGEWFAHNQDAVPQSLYLAQLSARRKAKP